MKLIIIFVICLILSSASLSVFGQSMTPEQLLESGKEQISNGKIIEGLLDMEKAVELEPNTERLLEYSIQLFFAENYDEAINRLNQILTSEPNNAEILGWVGYVHQNRMTYDKAITNYEKGLERDDNNILILSNIGHVYVQIGKYLDAQSSFDKAIEKIPNYISNLEESGQEFLEKEDYKAALVYFDQITQYDSENSIANTGLGFIFLEDKRHDEAIKFFDKVLEANNESDIFVDALRGKAITYNKMGEYIKSMELLNKVLEMNSNDAVAHFHKGLVFINLSDNVNALQSFDEALKYEPYNFEILSAKASLLGNDNQLEELAEEGNSLFDKNKYDEAIIFYNEILEINPSDTDVLFKKGLSLFNLHKYHLSINYFNQILDIEDEHANALAGKGYALIKIGKNDEAIPLIDTALELEPDYSYSLIAKAILLSNQGSHYEAIRHYDMVINQEPKNVIALTNKGLNLLELKKSEEALKYFEFTLKISPRYVDAITGKGNAYFNLKMFKDSLEACRSAYEIDSTNVVALNCMAASMLDLGDDDKAERLLDQILEENPESYTALINRGERHQKEGNFKDAIEYYNRALEIKQDHVYAMYKKAQSLAELDKFNQALRLYDRSLLIEKNNAQLLVGAGDLLSSRSDCLAIDYYDRALENSLDNREEVEEKLRQQVVGCTDVFGWISIANGVLGFIGTVIVGVTGSIAFLVRHKKKSNAKSAIKSS